MFENKVLRRKFGSKWGEVIGEWRKLPNEKLKDPYSSFSTVRVIKSRRMRWAGHVARMRQRGGVYRVLVGKLRKIYHLEDPGVDGRIILRRMFRKLVHGLDWSGSG